MYNNTKNDKLALATQWQNQPGTPKIPRRHKAAHSVTTSYIREDQLKVTAWSKEKAAYWAKMKVNFWFCTWIGKK